MDTYIYNLIEKREKKVLVESDDPNAPQDMTDLCYLVCGKTVVEQIKAEVHYGN